MCFHIRLPIMDSNYKDINTLCERLLVKIYSVNSNFGQFHLIVSFRNIELLLLDSI